VDRGPQPAKLLQDQFLAASGVKETQVEHADLHNLPIPLLLTALSLAGSRIYFTILKCEADHDSDATQIMFDDLASRGTAIIRFPALPIICLQKCTADLKNLDFDNRPDFRPKNEL
jgi:hypothetical protein